MYNNLHNYATEHKIQYKNDSDLVRKLLYKLTLEQGNIELTNYIMKDQIKQQKEQLDKQETLITKLQDIRIELSNKIEVLQQKVKSKKVVKKSTQKKTSV
jgi:hypothetical protein